MLSGRKEASQTDHSIARPKLLQNPSKLFAYVLPFRSLSQENRFYWFRGVARIEKISVATSSCRLQINVLLIHFVCLQPLTSYLRFRHRQLHALRDFWPCITLQTGNDATSPKNAHGSMDHCSIFVLLLSQTVCKLLTICHRCSMVENEIRPIWDLQKRK